MYYHTIRTYCNVLRFSSHVVRSAVYKYLLHRKTYPRWFLKQLSDLFPILINCIIMGGVCYLVQLPFEHHGVRLLLAIVTGVIYYLGSSFIGRSNELSEVLELIKQK